MKQSIFSLFFNFANNLLLFYEIREDFDSDSNHITVLDRINNTPQF